MIKSCNIIYHYLLLFWYELDCLEMWSWHEMNWLVFRIYERSMLISRLNLKLVQIGWKPPPLFCLLVRYSAHIMWHNITLLNHIPHIIIHHIKDLAEKPPPPTKNRENFLNWIYSFHAILSNFASAGRKAPPGTGNIFFRLDLSISCNFEQLWFQVAEKTPLFSAFSWETWLMSPMWNAHGPHTTNPHSDFSYPNIFFRLPTLSTFQNTHI